MQRSRLHATILLGLTVLCAMSTADDYVESAEAVARGVTAYREQNHDAFLNELTRANALRSDHPTYRFYLAVAQALSGDATASARTLSQIASWGIFVDAETQAEFDPVRDAPALQHAFAALRQNQHPQGAVGSRLTLPAAGGLYEGLAEHPRTHRLYLSDLHHGRILQVDETGEVQAFASSPAKGYGLGGLAIDAPRNLLWAASPAMPEVAGFEEPLSGHSQLLAFNVDDGSLAQSVAIPSAPGESRTVVDLTVAPDGTVYAPDSTSPVIWRIAPGSGEAEVFATIDRPGTRHSLQGAAFSPDGEWLLVSDYSTGLHRVNLQDRRIEFLNTPTEHIGTAVGIDGIAVCDDTLLAVQNGVTPARLLRIQLAPDGQPRSATSVASGLAELEEPTLVTTASCDFLIIGRAGWPYFGPQARNDSADRMVPVVHVPGQR